MLACKALLQPSLSRRVLLKSFPSVRVEVVAPGGEELLERYLRWFGPLGGAVGTQDTRWSWQSNGYGIGEGGPMLTEALRPSPPLPNEAANATCHKAQLQKLRGDAQKQPRENNVPSVLRRTNGAALRRPGRRFRVYGRSHSEPMFIMCIYDVPARRPVYVIYF